ncbi:enoyl-CoA hydratase-related protein [Aeromicrobium choanae]|uniref:2-(1,2-epoxy-1,2-dihydrophenyl)acetyl-CoA isomerase n=1 Tax=Aeromicrobium choanae TaxID=1736691 RepID=A0A1T4YX44_9ACTN|nr:enoyl-CoA hydratase-related protein [Aeromicrobium choanae]SKB06128.1 2-(1,2-epoxy-1,2-dihydrophenyl)acetyl-CoA isomerase [Aeromicrobium choanae]
MRETMDGTPALRAELDDTGVLLVTLDRPGARHALSLDLLEALAQALDLAATSDAVRAVALTGAGGAFCAGGDVRLMAQGRSIFGPADEPERRAAAQSDAQRRTVVRLRELGKPTVAIVDGPAVGAGLALALACDLRVAGESAMLMTGFGRVGLAGDFGCNWLLHDLVGRSTARELLLTSAPVPASEALRRGLVSEVHPDHELMERGLALARRLARVPAAAVEAMLSASDLAPSLSFAEACDRDARIHVRLAGTDAHRALVARLVERSSARSAGADG